MGDNRHPTGVVFAEIVKANIPVQNGVIHLIHKPLMIVDFTVKQFIEYKYKDKEDGILSKFYWAIQDLGDAGQEFLRTIERSNEVTLFAPNNAAWDDANLKNVMQDRQRMKEILDTHLVPGQSLSVDNIISRNRKQLFRVPTLAKRRNLYFNVLATKTERILTVEGGGVNATVVQENFAATNGIIHIIDRVLGVPYVTILEKLKTDPLLNDTFFLGSRQGFNSQLNKTDKKFTYFVPRNKAWSDAKISLPSVIKKLFMPQFTYHRGFLDLLV
ncbi:fasciclin-1 [Agrilus planipennis]|uniref:Fasciclin-1 n=1 Tax=Agrilus planipennis TaxID=224129 RepID=A0A7F5RGJ6_AGRPL|nr:fasciclin-1 [Agrilus planipennis]